MGVEWKQERGSINRKERGVVVVTLTVFPHSVLCVDFITHHVQHSRFMHACVVRIVAVPIQLDDLLIEDRQLTAL